MNGTMMKWVIGALLAATAGTPALAQDNDGDGRRGQWQQGRRVDGNEGQRPPRYQRQERPAATVDTPAQGGRWQGRRDRGGIPTTTGVETTAQAGGWRGRRDRGDVPALTGAQGQVGGWQGGRDRGSRNLAPPPDAPGSFDTGRRDWQRGGADGRSDRGRFDPRDNGRPATLDRNGFGRRDAYRDDRARWDGRRYDAPRYGDHNGDRWSRTWRTDNRFDWNRYRSSNRNAYRLPRYYAPYGWNDRYRRFAIGVTLSSVLWAQDYWIDEPYDYRLPPAYGPYRWVRYYNDALLIDLRSGLVVDTVYDIFWY